MQITEKLSDETSGIWAVKSSSSTIYYINLDNYKIFRARSGTSRSGLGDNTWVRISQMRNVEVGERGYYLLDPFGGAHDYQWWLQRVITSIEKVCKEELPPLAQETL